jgi:hypothetical protein
MRVGKRSGSAATARIMLIAAAFVVLLPTTASAHTVYSGLYVYDTHEDCVRNYSAVDGANGGGHYEGRISVEDAPNTTTSHCTRAYYRDAGWIAIKMDTYRWNDAAGQWEICAGTGWVHNSVSDHTLVLDLGPDAHPPCGAGYYGVYTNGAEYSWPDEYRWVPPAPHYDNWSGYHWLQ